MRKATKRVEEASAETQDVSPPKKTKLKEKKVSKETTQVVGSSRPTRAVKTRAAQIQNGVENLVEATRKPRGRGKPALRRSNSSSDIASLATGRLSKKKSQSAENLDQEDVPPAKKGRNIPAKTAKKPVAKKAGNEAKAKPRGRAAKEVELEGTDEDSGSERPLLMAKKAYRRATVKKAVPIETKDNDESKKRPVTKALAPVKKATRGRGKPVPVEYAEEEEEEAVVEEVKPAAKERKIRANGKRAVPAAVEEKEVEVDREDAENGDDELPENLKEPAKSKKGRKGTAAPKRSRVVKKAVPSAESDEKDVEAEIEDHGEIDNEDPELSKEEVKPAKVGGKRGKAPAPRGRVKKTTPIPKEDESEDSVEEKADERNTDTTDMEAPVAPRENDKSVENGKSYSFTEHNDKDDDVDNETPR